MYEALYFSMRAFQFTPNPLIFLLVILALILSVLPVSANVFYNGDFETGSLSPWVYDYYGINGGNDPLVYGGYAYSSSYGVGFSCSNYDGQGYKAIRHLVDFDKVTGDNLTFYANVRNQGGGKFQVYIDSTKVYESTADYGYNVFYPISINLGQYNFTGTKFIYFRAYANYGPGMEVRLDDIHLDGVPYDQELPEPEPEYTLYINGVSKNRNYYVNASEYPYTLFFYFQERLDFAVSDYEPGIKYFINCTSSNSSYPYSFEWMADPDSFDNWPAHLDTRPNHYPSGGKYLRIQYPDVPVAYTFNMYRVEVTEGAIPDAYFDLWPSIIGNWLRSRIGTSDVTLTKVDDITVVLNKVSEIPPDTPKNETSNPDFPGLDIPNIPGYESNYTPPQPQPGNDSFLGTSFLGGYYQTVDSIIGPIDSTVSGALYFVVSPVNTVSSSVTQVNGYATSTFDRVLFYVSPFGLFFTVIFDAIPDETEIIIMFSLVCGLILIVLRWK